MNHRMGPERLLSRIGLKGILTFCSFYLYCSFAGYHFNETNQTIHESLDGGGGHLLLSSIGPKCIIPIYVIPFHTEMTTKH